MSTLSVDNCLNTFVSASRVCVAFVSSSRRRPAAQHVFDKVWKTACYILVAEFFVEMVISPAAYDHKLTSNQKLNFYSNPLGPQTTLNLLTYNVLDPVPWFCPNFLFKMIDDKIITICTHHLCHKIMS